jgi:multisubunit Na+/H+ antiporter MnhE subunit
MSFAFNVGKLVFNFFKGLVLSGWDTAWVIVRDSSTVRSGMTRMPYGDLDPKTASLLGGLISLTPGTTMVSLDLQRRELLLHLLDLERREATITTIQRDFVTPLLELRGDRE